MLGAGRGLLINRSQPATVLSPLLLINRSQPVTVSPALRLLDRSRPVTVSPALRLLDRSQPATVLPSLGPVRTRRLTGRRVGCVLRRAGMARKGMAPESLGLGRAV